MPNNKGHWLDGSRSQQVRRQLLEAPEARAALAEFRHEVETDLGGQNALSRIQRDLINRYVETVTIADWLSTNLMAFGMLTPKGRQRAALSAFLLVLDRQHRLAQTLGIERRTKHVDPLTAVINAVSAANPAPEQPPEADQP